MIAIWTAAEIAPGRSGCQKEPVGAVLADDHGDLLLRSGGDDDALLGTSIVELYPPYANLWQEH